VTAEDQAARFAKAWNVLHEGELARLVADQITAAVLEERDACAEIATKHRCVNDEEGCSEIIAEAIRARGQT
jgi:hypothetical protein